MNKDDRDFLIAAGGIALLIWFFSKIKGKCPRCNYPVTDKNIICPNCGQPLDGGIINE
jgi:predicted amidophosphoribosyltransferase